MVKRLLARLRLVWVSLALLAGHAGCHRDSASSITGSSSALTGNITISGTITDAAGLPLGGVTVHLDGSKQATVLENNGSYAFTGLLSGSYSVRPTMNGCSFIPDVVNLNNLTASRTQNFGGAGASCGGAASVNTGATTGALTISGHVRDSSGRPVVGAQLNLDGATRAIRFSDFTGGFTFHVDRGSFTLVATTSTGCPLTPAGIVGFNNITTNKTQDFVGSGAACTTSSPIEVTATGQKMLLRTAGDVVGEVTARLETFADQATAVARLQAIAGQPPTGASRSVTIAGLPAVERQVSLQIAGGLDPDEGLPAAERFTFLTTSIAFNGTVVRFERHDPGTIAPVTANAFFAAARNFSPEELAGLHGALPAPTVAGTHFAFASPPPLAPQLGAALIDANRGEVAIAAADSTNHVVYGVNAGAPLVSIDGGRTTQVATVNRSNNGQGDPGAGVGPADAQGNQTFYYSELSSDITATDPGTGKSFGVKRVNVFASTDGGLTFNQLPGSPRDCTIPVDGHLPCSIPDQPQMAVDRVAPAAGGGDILYMAWRQFDLASHFQAVYVNCSRDGGNSWGASPLSMTIPEGGDMPRLAVGPKGSVLLAFSGGTDDQHYGVWVQKFARCDSQSQLQPIGASVPVVTPLGSIPEVPGVNRTPGAAPYGVAFDDTDPNEKRVFVMAIDETSQNNALRASDGVPALANDDIRLAESIDGGANWKTSSSLVNRTSTGHRFLPWMCMSKGVGYITWYDRRDATLASTDLTSYYFASFADPTNSGTPTLGAEVNVSGGTAFDDPQCLSGFQLIGVSNPDIETLCTDLPPLPTLVAAGECVGPCQSGGGTCAAEGCDFRAGAPACNRTGYSCGVGTGATIPVYGDYNGAACAGGQLFMAWTTSVPPAGAACALQGGTCAADTDCCNPALQCLSGICQPPSSTSCTANNATCARNFDCCSGNCVGNVCHATVGIFASSTDTETVMTCATSAVPDKTFSTQFSFDTGISSPVGANYGQTACRDQYLVEIDLTQSLQGRDFFVSGGWSITLPQQPCNEQATMSVFAFDGNAWQLWDVVGYVGQPQGSLCHAQAISHTNPGSVGLGGTNIPASKGFKRIRIAEIALQGGAKIPVSGAGD